MKAIETLADNGGECTVDSTLQQTITTKQNKFITDFFKLKAPKSDSVHLDRLAAKVGAHCQYRNRFLSKIDCVLYNERFGHDFPVITSTTML